MLVRLAVRVVRALNAALVARLARQATLKRASSTDRTTFRLSADLEVRTCWIDRPGEVGPAASVLWGRQELLRIDMFDDDTHLHYGLAQSRLNGAASARVMVAPRSIEARGERAAFEIEHNLRYCLANHPSRRVRELEITAEELHDAGERVRQEFARLARAHDR